MEGQKKQKNGKNMPVYKKKPNGKNAVGRPDKYKPEYTQDILNYFQTCQAEILIDLKFFMPNKNVTVKDILNPLAKEDQEDEKLQA
jgi:hypothetical protein